MVGFIIFDRDGVELRRGNCPTEMVDLQCDDSAGERVVRHDCGDDAPDTFRLDANGEISPYQRPVDPADLARREWRRLKSALATSLAGGYPSNYGPVDLREGAKAAMAAAITLNRGMDLILLDNRILTLDADQLRSIFAEATAWEQAQIMATQALRPQ